MTPASPIRTGSRTWAGVAREKTSHLFCWTGNRGRSQFGQRGLRSPWAETKMRAGLCLSRWFWEKNPRLASPSPFQKLPTFCGPWPLRKWHDSHLSICCHLSESHSPDADPCDDITCMLIRAICPSQDPSLNHICKVPFATSGHAGSLGLGREQPWGGHSPKPRETEFRGGKEGNPGDGAEPLSQALPEAVSSTFPLRDGY